MRSRRELRNRLWTAREIKLLEKHYPAHGPRGTVKFIGRTQNAIRTKAFEMGIKRIWTEGDIWILRKYYPSEGMAVSKRLPRYTRQECRFKAKRLGISRAHRKRESVPRWTEAELEVLRKNISAPLSDLAPLFPSRTLVAVKLKRAKMKRTRR